MTHNEKRGHWAKEGLISTVTGALFGATYVAMSHVRLKNNNSNLIKLNSIFFC